MPTQTVESITIAGKTCRVRPATADDHVNVAAWLEGHDVVEYSDDSPDEDAEPIRTYGIQCVPNLLDADGRVVGFVCPGCGEATLLNDADEYADGYRGCLDGECKVLVACADVLRLAEPLSSVESEGD